MIDKIDHILEMHFDIVIRLLSAERTQNPLHELRVQVSWAVERHFTSRKLTYIQPFNRRRDNSAALDDLQAIDGEAKTDSFARLLQVLHFRKHLR